MSRKGSLASRLLEAFEAAFRGVFRFGLSFLGVGWWSIVWPSNSEGSIQSPSAFLILRFRAEEVWKFIIISSSFLLLLFAGVFGVTGAGSSTIGVGFDSGSIAVDSEVDQAEEESFDFAEFFDVFEEVEDFDVVEALEIVDFFDCAEVTELFEVFDAFEVVDFFEEVDAFEALVSTELFETFDVVDSPEALVETELTDSLEEEDMILIDSFDAFEEEEEETIDTSSLLISTGLSLDGGFLGVTIVRVRVYIRFKGPFWTVVVIFVLAATAASCLLLYF